VSGRHWLPWRQEPNPWRVLLAETVLHRTRADIAAIIYARLLTEFRDPATVVASPSRWRDLVRSAGLAWRAEAFLKCCEVLVKEYGGRVPSDLAFLEALPGVGHYTANAVRCFGFGMASVLIDTNTIRLASRISGEVAPKERHRARYVQQLVARLGDGGVPPSAEDNFALLDLAAVVCLPNKPICSECPVQMMCATGQRVKRGSLRLGRPTPSPSTRAQHGTGVRHRSSGQPC
jgi:A/G-specific adenine glycosylase